MSLTQLYIGGCGSLGVGRAKCGAFHILQNTSVNALN